MAAQLTEKGMHREIHVYGVEGTCVLHMSTAGITFKAKGTKLGVSLGWPELVESCKTPSNIPSKFEGRPLDFLKYQSQERAKRIAKRLAKEKP